MSLPEWEPAGARHERRNRLGPSGRSTYTPHLVSDLPFQLAPEAARELASVLDVEGKILRGLEALGPVAGRDVLLVDAAGSTIASGLQTLGARVAHGELTAPFQPLAADESMDAIVGLWSLFRGVRPDDVAAADRVLRPGGRLLVVHDYGRDDVSRLAPDREEFGAWTRRDGPFLRAGFRVRVLHCFWTFASQSAATVFLESAFGEAGAAVATSLKRPRLSYNVAIYHRVRGGEAPSPS